MKASDVRQFIHQGDFKKALCGAKNFRIGVTKEQRSVMSRAYEAMVHSAFYRQLGRNIDECVQAGIAVLREVV